MGFPEDKVNLLDDDNQETPPPPIVVDEIEYDDNYNVCRVMCVALTYLLVLGVFLTSFAYHSSSNDRDSLGYEKGYKARVRQMRPGEDFSNVMRDFRMEEERRRMKMFPEFRSWSKLSKTYDPPPRSEKAKTARYIVHNSDWGSVSTISASMDGAPFGMAASFSDGTVANSTGVPYFYLAKYDPVVKNMESNALSSLALSEAQSGYCKEHNWDPEEPLCSRVTVIGKLVHVGPDEEKFAQNALFSRHPVMKTWPKDHGWQTLKLEITHVWLVDIYGPPTIVPVEDYFKVKL